MRKNLINSWLLATLYFAAVLPGLLLGGCESWLPEAHKIDIQQGNRVNAEDLDRLQTGMTREQVKFLLGTPLLQDAFHQNRWDYLYYLQPGKEEARQSRVSLFFDGNILVKIDREQYKPDAQKTTEDKPAEGK
ncbi:MAG: outer membrane protein assembly factor BamE [Pseudomonadota bacterium]|nr:outer membrane protein assembly factor BamE [Pseudomonadota bacterium]